MKPVPITIEETDDGIILRSAVGSLSYWPGMIIRRDDPEFAKWRYFFKMAEEQAEYLKRPALEGA